MRIGKVGAFEPIFGINSFELDSIWNMKNFTYEILAWIKSKKILQESDKCKHCSINSNTDILFRSWIALEWMQIIRTFCWEIFYPETQIWERHKNKSESPIPAYSNSYNPNCQNDFIDSDLFAINLAILLSVAVIIISPKMKSTTTNIFAGQKPHWLVWTERATKRYIDLKPHL